MTPDDELRAIWCSAAGDVKCDPSVLSAEIERRTRGFERTIRHRDAREAAGGLLVAVIFTWLAFRDPTALERAAHLFLAVCGLWVIGYMRRFARSTETPDPRGTLAECRRGLIARYDAQVLLLRNAKYWYVLPFWAGLMASSVAGWLRTHNLPGAAITIVIVTAVSLGLWWANEVAGVRYIEGLKRQLANLTGDEE
jgi:hypothetical protein